MVEDKIPTQNAAKAPAEGLKYEELCEHFSSTAVFSQDFIAGELQRGKNAIAQLMTAMFRGRCASGILTNALKFLFIIVSRDKSMRSEVPEDEAKFQMQCAEVRWDATGADESVVYFLYNFLQSAYLAL